MKKLFTLIACLACFLGARAEWVVDKEFNYSDYSGYPFRVTWFVPEWVDGVMTDLGGDYRYVDLDNPEGLSSDVIVKTNDGGEYYRIPTDGSTWHQYGIGDGIPVEEGVTYTIKAMVKASEPLSIPIAVEWSWAVDPVETELHVGTEWTEVECDFTAIGGTQCDLYVHSATSASIEWKWIKVSHYEKDQGVVWVDLINNGNAEQLWWDLDFDFPEYDDMENNYKVCVWTKTFDGESVPVPADIRDDDDDNDNHIFVCDTNVDDTEGEVSAEDNQIWLESPREWRAGERFRLSFRYKATWPVVTNTQVHRQKPSDYLHWQGIGNIAFTREWQQYDRVITVPAEADGMWSVVFNLNAFNTDHVTFYIDDLSWCEMKPELITNGDAELSWETLDLADVAFDDQDNNYKVCLWTKEKGVNNNNPHVAEIIEDEDGRHAFICHATTADTDGDDVACDNQIWLESPREWKAGEKFLVSFRYKASEPAVVETEAHGQKPSDNLHCQVLDDISFTTEWQKFEQIVTVPAEADGMWSIALNLNADVKDAVDFYIDDLSWGDVNYKEYRVGDTNGDGYVNVGDYNTLVNYIQGNTDAGIESQMDVNNDGEVNTDDLNTIVNIITNK